MLRLRTTPGLKSKAFCVPRDLDDMRALFKIHRASLDMEELREYFALFKHLELLDELLG